MQVVLRFVLTGNGAPCVMTTGMHLMPQWYANNLDSLDLVSYNIDIALKMIQTVIMVYTLILF